MNTLTIEIENKSALNILKGLEQANLIRIVRTISTKGKKQSDVEILEAMNDVASDNIVDYDSLEYISKKIKKAERDIEEKRYKTFKSPEEMHQYFADL